MYNSFNLAINLKSSERFVGLHVIFGKINYIYSIFDKIKFISETDVSND